MRPAPFRLDAHLREERCVRVCLRELDDALARNDDGLCVRVLRDEDWGAGGARVSVGAVGVVRVVGGPLT